MVFVLFCSVFVLFLGLDHLKKERPVTCNLLLLVVIVVVSFNVFNSLYSCVPSIVLLFLCSFVSMIFQFSTCLLLFVIYPNTLFSLIHWELLLSDSLWLVLIQQ